MSTAVVDLEAERLPPALAVGERYRRALVLIRWRGRPVGHITLPVERGMIAGARLREAVVSAAGRQILAATVREYLSWEEAEAVAPPPSATVAVCTRDRPEDLARCLDAIERMPDDGQEILVVDSASTGGGTRRTVAAHPHVRYLREDRPGLDIARNRALREARHEVVAFVDDDAAPDQGWLRAILRNFGDPRTQCVTGLTMPVELETRAQELFEATFPFGRGYERRVFDSTRQAFPVGIVGAGANMALRRSVTTLVGEFDEALDAGTPTHSGGDHDMFTRILAGGYSIVYDPAALSWHRHRRDWEALQRVFYGYGAGIYAYVARQVLKNRESFAPVIALGWLRDLLPALAGTLLRRPNHLPLDLILAALRGSAAGPLAYLRSRRAHPAARIEARVSPWEEPSTPKAASELRDVSGSASRPEISVVIPTHNRRDSLLRLVRALRDGTFAPQRFEVIVVANGCTDDTVDALRREPLPFTLRVLEQNPGLGPAGGRNLGASQASGALLVFLDDDIEPLPSALEAHARAHASADGEAVVIGPPFPVRSAGRSGDFQQLAVWQWWHELLAQMSRPGHRFSYHNVLSGNLSIPAGLFGELGGFDSAFNACCDDWELGVRLIRRGARILIAPEAAGLHHEMGDRAGAIRRKLADGHADVRLARKHPYLWPTLRLAWPERRLEGLLRRLAFCAPRLERPIRIGLGSVLDVVEWLRLRNMWQNVSGQLLHYSYWRGVAQAIGTRQAVADLERWCTAQSEVEHTEAEIDLRDGLPAAERLLDETRPHGARISLDGCPVGRIPPIPGAEPLRGAHLRQILATELVQPLLVALAVAAPDDVTLSDYLVAADTARGAA